MMDERGKIVAAATAILDEAHERTQEQQRLDADREWDVWQATAALKAVTGLCTTHTREGQEEVLDVVGRGEMAALLSLISDRLERSAKSAS